MAKKSSSGTAPAEDASLVELSFEQMRELEEKRRQEEKAHVREESEKIRQLREEEGAKGKSKKKPEEKITLGLAPVVIEEKKAGLPDRIKKLPKNHPERVLYEKGYKEREHKEWVEASKRRRQAVRRVDKLLIAEVFVFVLAVGSLYYGILKYVDKVDYTRGEIIKVLKHKQYSLRDPKISDDFQYLHMVNWLPRLNDLFVKAKSLEFNYDTLDDNPEEGTYLDYIRRHKKPFDEREAMAWRIREVRKPKSAHD